MTDTTIKAKMVPTRTIEEVRETLRRVVHERLVSAEEAEDVRESIEALYQDASKHGLTKRDVLRSLLSPLFKSGQNCDCPGCKFRRGEIGESQQQD